jgi:rubredoxin
MLVAKSDYNGRVFAGPDVQNLNAETRNKALTEGFTCPSCEKPVRYTDASADQPFEYFQHTDGSPDCFDIESVSDSHRLATESTLKELHNRVRAVTGKPVEIDDERWVGIRPNFIIADIRVTSPLQVAAEVYYKSERLALGRKLDTMFENDYRTFLVFHTNGRHDVNRVQRYIQRVASLRIGRFTPESLEVTLGDLFTEQEFKLSSANRDRLPNYIAR